jgi:predicted phosphodiesterase
MTMSQDETKKKKAGVLGRREFLMHTGLASAALLIGCSDDNKPAGDKDAGQDMALDQDVAELEPDMVQAPDEAPDQPVGLPNLVTKAPWVQLMDAGSARLRFESSSMTALAVTIARGAMGEPQAVTPALRVDEVGYSWPMSESFKKRAKVPDNPGTFTIQDVLIEGLAPGEEVRWTVGDGVTTAKLEGRFKAPPAPGTPVRVGWLSDTMMPESPVISALLASKAPDLVLHGGDIQYMTNPFDTWNGAFDAFSAFTKIAPIHFCIGNHEYEAQKEFDAQYMRLFGAHGESDRTVDYHVVSYGSLRIFMLNSEIEMADQESAQNKWLRRHLEALPAGAIPIVAFHRPYFTFSRSRPNFTTRDLMHPLLVQYKVPLVLTGHNHGYERFEVDGVQYVVDAGGGAFIYDVDGGKDEVLAERPGDEALRKVASPTYGALILDVDAQGAILLTRYDKAGVVVDTLTIQRPT